MELFIIAICVVWTLCLALFCPVRTWDAFVDNVVAISGEDHVLHKTGFVAIWLDGVLLRWLVHISFYETYFTIDHISPFKKSIRIYYREIDRIDNTTKYKNDYQVERKGHPHTVSLKRIEADILNRFIKRRGLWL